MTQNDPTNSALAAIASIFGPSRRAPAEPATAPEGDARQAEEAAAPSSAQGGADQLDTASGSTAADGDKAPTEAAAEQPEQDGAEASTELADAEQGEPAQAAEGTEPAEAEPDAPTTDAADQDAPEQDAAEQDLSDQDVSEQVLSEQVSAEQAQDEPAASEPAAVAAPMVPMSDEEIDGYSRSGPGPLDSLRFKWTARRDEDGAFYVDETIGFASRPISTGPLPREQVIAFIDQRARQAQERFDALRSEMIRPSAERQQQAERHFEEVEGEG